MFSISIFSIGFSGPKFVLHLWVQKSYISQFENLFPVRDFRENLDVAIRIKDILLSMIGSQDNALQSLHPDRAQMHTTTGNHTQKEEIEWATHIIIFLVRFARWLVWWCQISALKMKVWREDTKVNDSAQTLTRLVTTSGQSYISQRTWCHVVCLCLLCLT